MFLGFCGLYALGRWFFAWRQARRDGDSHPVRAVLDEEDEPQAVKAAPPGAFRSYRQFFGYVGSMVAVVLLAAFTSGRLRVALLGTIAPLLVMGLSYLDFRQARRMRSHP